MRRMLIGLCLFVSVAAWSQNEALFDQGKEQYKAENYQEALNQWMKILNSGEHSANLYFNIANAHYKLNHIGPSIYYYEKALQLDPNDDDVKNNLAFAQNATIDVINPLPLTFFAKWDQRVSQLLPYNSWAIVTVIALLLFTFLFIRYYFSLETRSKRGYFIGSCVALFVAITAISMAFKTYHQAEKKRNAIIFAATTDIKSGPRMSEQTVFQLHEGTKVQILAQEEEWSRIAIADGKDGWLPTADIKEL